MNCNEKKVEFQCSALLSFILVRNSCIIPDFTQTHSFKNLWVEKVTKQDFIYEKVQIVVGLLVIFKC